MSASSESLPLSTRRSAAAAAMVLLMDPAWNWVDVVTGAQVDASRTPQLCAHASLPSWMTATLIPGTP